jgi:AraC-like DNA-binding protein
MQQAPAPPDLAPWVKCFWQVQADGSSEAGPPCIVPDGCMELVVELGPVSSLLDASGQPVCQARGVLAGQFDGLIPLASSAGYAAFGVRFQPWGAAPLLAMPASELSNSTVSMHDFFGAPGSELEERLHAAPSFEARVALALHFLRRRVPRRARSSWLPWAVAQLQGGGASVRGLAQQMQVSPRQLERSFAIGVGLTPKRYAQWQRLRGALVQARHRPGLTAVAHGAGYADQAHLSRECRQLTGLTPTALLRTLDPLAAALSAF